MASTAKNRVFARTALLIAVCFCTLSMARITRPLFRTNRVSSPAASAARQQLTRHTLEEVSPRAARLRAPRIIGLLPIIPVNYHGRLVRKEAYVPFWPTEGWPIHRRLAPACADNPAVPA